MSSLLGIATSGLAAATLQLDVSANNVANADTPGFTPGGVAQETAAQGGVTAQPINNDPAVANQLDHTLAGLSSGTDLAAETVNQIAAVSAFQANIKSVEADETTDQALMNIHA